MSLLKPNLVDDRTTRFGSGQEPISEAEVKAIVVRAMTLFRDRAGGNRALGEIGGGGLFGDPASSGGAWLGRAMPSLAHFIRLAAAFPDVDLNALVRGESLDTTVARHDRELATLRRAVEWLHGALVAMDARAGTGLAEELNRSLNDLANGSAVAKPEAVERPA
jgi:hypothetical protein